MFESYEVEIGQESFVCDLGLRDVWGFGSWVGFCSVLCFLFCFFSLGVYFVYGLCTLGRLSCINKI